MIEHRFNPWPIDPAKAEQQARYAVRKAYYREHYQRNRETILRKANLRHARKRAGITPEIEAMRILLVLLALNSDA